MVIRYYLLSVCATSEQKLIPTATNATHVGIDSSVHEFFCGYVYEKMTDNR